MSQQAAKRRRKQAANGYGHVGPMDRPNYKKRSKEAAAKHLANLIAKERRMSAGKNKKKN